LVNNTPLELTISQRSSEERIGPATHPDQIRVGQNIANLSQAKIRPLSNIIFLTLFQLTTDE